MRTRVFGLLLLMAGGIMFAQTSATKGLSISVTAPPSPTGNLLTGKTPANFTLPSGWSVLCTQDFEASASGCLTGTGVVTETGVQTTVQAHSGSGSHSIRGGAPYGSAYAKVQFTTTVPNGWTEIYQSWYQRLDPFTSGVGFWFSGADFYVSDFHSSTIDAKINYCCGTGNGNTSGNFGFSNGPLLWQPEDYGDGVDTSNLDRFIDETSVNFDGAWHQWEVRYRKSTQSCSPKDAYQGCADGTLQVWTDGVLRANFQNVDLNGPANMNGTEQSISGHSGTILWAKNPSIVNAYDKGLACQQVAAGTLDGGVFQCGSTVSDGYGCDTSWWGATYAWTNSKCPGMAPPNTFYKYIDDVIVLYK